MIQVIYGLILFIFLMLPPVVKLLESIMIIHMHMQMPLLVIAGFLMAPFFQKMFPTLFRKWNANGLAGILLFLIIMLYWTMPRAMDEALTIPAMEVFKFMSLPFFAGVPLRDSWKKLGKIGKNAVFVVFLIVFVAMGVLYIASPVQLCNNYLRTEQITLGWGYLAMSAAILIYLIQLIVIEPSKYE
ncbi:MAG TPA: hypothetical protein VK136_10720 [Bacillota bacterium]|nr:hypothetical protein [Bacillota bacterium]